VHTGGRFLPQEAQEFFSQEARKSGGQVFSHRRLGDQENWFFTNAGSLSPALLFKQLLIS
jgi:hypothetical protein